MTLMLHAFPEDWAPAERLARTLGVALSLVETRIFADGETLPRVLATTPTTIFYCSLDRPNTKVMNLLLAADALRRNGAERLVLVAPYLPYMRQDKAFAQGEPVSQRVMAGLLDQVFERIITADPHLHRTQSLEQLLSRAEFTLIHAGDALVDILKPSPYGRTVTIVGAGASSSDLAHRIGERLGRRTIVLGAPRADEGLPNLPPGSDLTNASVLLVDDICATPERLVAAMGALKRAGASRIDLFVTHGLWTHSVLWELRSAGADWIAASDSCDQPAEEIRLASLFATALQDEFAAAPCALQASLSTLSRVAGKREGK